jgi:hypothetical protein
MAWPSNVSDYPRPVAQFDPTACWAASLEWWLAAMSPARAEVDQLNLLQDFNGFWNTDESSPDYGTVSEANLRLIYAWPTVRMSSRKFTNGMNIDFIKEKLAKSPVVVGYYEPAVNSYHVAVIHSVNVPNSPYGEINVMDPNRGRFRQRGSWRFTRREHLLFWSE